MLIYIDVPPASLQQILKKLSLGKSTDSIKTVASPTFWVLSGSPLSAALSNSLNSKTRIDKKQFSQTEG